MIIHYIRYDLYGDIPFMSCGANFKNRFQIDPKRVTTLIKSVTCKKCLKHIEKELKKAKERLNNIEG